MQKLVRVAVLGGSFDPPTLSHLKVGQHVKTLLHFDEVWFVPCGFRPDKTHISLPALRLQMIKMAVADFFPNESAVYKVNDIEIENGTSIPTYFLMKQLIEKHAATHQFHFVAGSDLLDSLHLWNEGEKLIKDISFVVVERKGYFQADIRSHKNFPQKDPLVIQADETDVDELSSTEVRKRVKASEEGGADLSNFVTSSVEAFIHSQKLYR